MNKPSTVNLSMPPGGALEQQLLAKLQDLLAGVPWLPAARLDHHPVGRNARGDFVVRLARADGRAAELHVHVKTDMRPSQFHAMDHAWRGSRAGQTAVPILGVTFASDRLSKFCRDAKWSWFDLAGNCWIDVPDFLHIERAGNSPVYRRPPQGASLGSTAAARLVRAVLTPVHAGRAWKQRDLQSDTCWPSPDGRGVSLGLVNKVVNHLVEEDYLERASDGVRLKEAPGLLAAWNKAYRFDRHQRLSYFTLLKGQRLAEALGRVGFESGNLAAYGSFSAAERQTPHVPQPKTWVYVDAGYKDLLVRQTEAKEVDSGENLVVLIPDDLGVMVQFTGGDEGHIGERRLHCTDPVQTYVDLMHSGGRGEEAAQAILEQKLLPAWKAAGAA
ncbi:MAG: hypothetical protein L6R43_02835 [Planctomycetes bacterium]|nr:hypothetical protein [Planctomycetota bacterium]